MKLQRSAPALTVAVLALVGCQSPQDVAPPNTLVAAKSTAAPNLAAGATDPVWSNARPLTVALTDGANFGAKPGDRGDTKAMLKAVYSGDMLYMLIQYADPTNSKRRGPYQKQADGSWKKLTDPDDKGGDDNIYYEDKWAMM